MFLFPKFYKMTNAKFTHLGYSIFVVAAGLPILFLAFLFLIL